MRIIGPESASRETVMLNLPANTNTLFKTTMFPLLWDKAEMYTIDPVGVVAQSGKETAWGNFGTKVTAGFCNSCGLKIPEHMRSFIPGVTDEDNPLTHQIFPNWEVGIEAQVQHLRAYTGWPVMEFITIVDPRYGLVKNKWIENWSELGGVGRWAPAPDYGVRIEEIMKRLQGKV